MNSMNPFLNDGTLPVNQSPETGSADVSEDVRRREQTLRDCVEQALRNYFEHLDGQDVTDVYDMVLAEVEAPLLESVMHYVKGNQTEPPKSSVSIEVLCARNSSSTDCFKRQRHVR